MSRSAWSAQITAVLSGFTGAAKPRLRTRAHGRSFPAYYKETTRLHCSCLVCGLQHCHRAVNMGPGKTCNRLVLSGIVLWTSFCSFSSNSYPLMEIQLWPCCIVLMASNNALVMGSDGYWNLESDSLVYQALRHCMGSQLTPRSFLLPLSCH